MMTQANFFCTQPNLAWTEDDDASKFFLYANKFGLDGR